MESAFLIIQALRGAALSCLHALRLAAGPVSAGWLCAATGYSAKTVRSALQKLQVLRLVNYFEPEAGWALAQAEALEALFEPRKNAKQETLDSESSSNSLKREEKDSGDLRDSIASSDSEVAVPPECSQVLHPEELLPAIQELFGEPLLLPRKEMPEIGLLLALVAEAHHKREKLDYPARAVCGSLKKRRKPDPRFFERPWEFLPAWFLERIGLTRPGERPPEKCPPDERPPDEDAPRVAGSPEEPGGLRGDEVSLAQPIGLQPGLAAGEAWLQACGRVRERMPPAAYARYLQGAAALEFDAEQGVLLVSAADRDSRLWLGDRLRPYLERELGAFAGRQVRLEVCEPP
ncbi:MAG: hypothetical protein MUE67_09705 [Anaerolineales bacterium]|nr:hypothetical protein [Anaerolineales bacterium]